jgi:hypothetical protein
MSLCSATSIFAICSNRIKNITTRLAPIYRCTRTRRSRASPRPSVAYCPCQSWADYTTNMATTPNADSIHAKPVFPHDAACSVSPRQRSGSNKRSILLRCMSQLLALNVSAGTRLLRPHLDELRTRSARGGSFSPCMTPNRPWTERAVLRRAPSAQRSRADRRPARTHRRQPTPWRRRTAGTASRSRPQCRGSDRSRNRCY